MICCPGRARLLGFNLFTGAVPPEWELVKASATDRNRLWGTQDYSDYYYGSDHDYDSGYNSYSDYGNHQDQYDSSEGGPEDGFNSTYDDGDGLNSTHDNGDGLNSTHADGNGLNSTYDDGDGFNSTYDDGDGLNSTHYEYDGGSEDVEDEYGSGYDDYADYESYHSGGGSSSTDGDSTYPPGYDYDYYFVYYYQILYAYYGDYYEDYEAVIDEGGAVDVSFNLLVGELPALSGRNLTAQYNCGMEGAPAQRFCPGLHGLLWLWLALGLVMLPVVAIAVRLCLEGWKTVAHDIAFGARRLTWSTTSNKVLLLAVALSLGWNLFVLTDTFEVLVRQMSLRLTTLGGIFFVVASSVGSSLNPAVVFLLLMLWARNALWSAVLGRPDSTAWTVIASEDVLRESVSVTQEDQLTLLAVFAAVAPLSAALNYAVLPDTIPMWFSPDPDSYWLVSPWLQTGLMVPRAAVSLFSVGFVIAVYHMVACLALPHEIWHCPSVSQALRLNSSNVSPVQNELLRSLRWLRAAYAVSALILLLLGGSSWAAVRLYVDGFASMKDELTPDTVGAPVNPTQGPTAVMSVAVIVQILVVLAWHAGAWGWWAALDPWTQRSSSKVDPYSGVLPPPSYKSAAIHKPPDHTGLATEDFQRPSSAAEHLRHWLERLRRWLQAKSAGRTRLCRNLLLAVVGLSMLPGLGAKESGFAVLSLAWGGTYLALLYAMLAEDSTGSFMDLISGGKAGFGLVLDARDVAAALAADLREEERERKSGEAPEDAEAGPGPPGLLERCCDGSPGGCKACQGILRRYPATLFRMQETLALSYRWQMTNRVIASRSPSNAGGRAAGGAGIINGQVAVKHEPLAEAAAAGHSQAPQLRLRVDRRALHSGCSDAG